jgi:hypothetical protein
MSSAGEPVNAMPLDRGKPRHHLGRGGVGQKAKRKKLVDRLSTKAKVEGGKPVTSSAQPPPTS